MAQKPYPHINEEDAAWDPYPAVLEHVGKLLVWGYEADNVNEAEAGILIRVAQAVRQVVVDLDDASEHMVPAPPALPITIKEA